jgi:hypothetical protein
MRTTQIINGLGNEELLKWKVELKSILDESRWKLIKTERALHLHQSALQECKEKLESERKRVEETKMALQFLSETHPLRHKCEDDIYRAEIRIFRLENKLKKFSILKPIQLGIKKIAIEAEIKYYEGVLKSIENMLRPTFILQLKQRAIDGGVRNVLPDEEKIFILQHSEPTENLAFQPTKDKISRKLEMTTFSLC